MLACLVCVLESNRVQQASRGIKMKIVVAICISLAVVSLMFAGQSSAKVDPKTAAGIWLFDEGAGNVAKDTSANGNDGKFVGNPAWAKGKFGNALKFDGSSTWLYCCFFCRQTHHSMGNG